MSDYRISAPVRRSGPTAEYRILHPGRGWVFWRVTVDRLESYCEREDWYGHKWLRGFTRGHALRRAQRYIVETNARDEANAKARDEAKRTAAEAKRKLESIPRTDGEGRPDLRLVGRR